MSEIRYIGDYKCVYCDLHFRIEQQAEYLSHQASHSVADKLFKEAAENADKKITKAKQPPVKDGLGERMAKILYKQDGNSLEWKFAELGLQEIFRVKADQLIRECGLVELDKSQKLP